MCGNPYVVTLHSDVEFCLDLYAELDRHPCASSLQSRNSGGQDLAVIWSAQTKLVWVGSNLVEKGALFVYANC